MSNPATYGTTGGNPPIVVISLDCELCWGSFDHSYGEELIRMARWTHDVGYPNLLGLFTRNELSATWAIVGGAMRDSLPDVSNFPEVSYPHYPKPWFGLVPRDGNESTNPEWFGPSLVRMIQKASPAQEIGFHSFSHVLFGYPGMTRERAVAEYQQCCDIAREFNFRPESFVFPRNSVAYLREMRQAGFSCYRAMDRLRFQVSHGKLRSALGVAADFAGLSPVLVRPYMDGELVAIPGSLHIRFARGWRKHIPDSSRLRRLKKGLDLVQREGGVFHVWFHPENLYAERPRLENVVAEFLDELGKLVRNGRVRCLTMGQLASEYRVAASEAGAIA
jgi:hypothetical protein